MIQGSELLAGMVKAPTTLPNGLPLSGGTTEDWTAALAPFVTAGFHGVEIHDGWMPFPQFTDSQIRQLQQALEDTGLHSPAAAIARHSVIEPGAGKDNLAYTLRGLEVAKELGADMVCVGLHPVLTPTQHAQRYFWEAPGRRDETDSATWDIAVERFQTIADRAAELGQDISLEIYEDTLLGQTSSALQLLSDIHRDNVGLNPDIGNLLRLDRPMEHWRDMLEQMLPVSNYWHVKNYVRTDREDGADTAPTTLENGVIDYREALRMAHDVGFDGILVCEQYSDDWLEVIESNRVFLEHEIRQLHASVSSEAAS